MADKYASDEDWLTEEEMARIRERVVPYFPDATIDRDGTFTVHVITIAEMLDRLHAPLLPLDETARYDELKAHWDAGNGTAKGFRCEIAK